MCGLGRSIISSLSRTTQRAPPLDTTPRYHPENEAKSSKASITTTQTSNSDEDSSIDDLPTSLESAEVDVTAHKPKTLADLPPELRLLILELLSPVASVCAGLTCRSLWSAHRRLHPGPISLETQDDWLRYMTPEGFEIISTNELGRLLQYWNPFRKDRYHEWGERLERGRLRSSISSEAAKVPKRGKWVREIKDRRRPKKARKKHVRDGSNTPPLVPGPTGARFCPNWGTPRERLE